MANRVNVYPDWVEKYRDKGITIRKTKYGYGLYKCTSIYDPSKKYPVVKQEFLGMVYEDKGFVPKRVNNEYKEPNYLEYGLSKFIMLNFKRDLRRVSYDGNENIIKLGIIKYIFGSYNKTLLAKSYLTYSDDDLFNYLDKANNKRIDKVAINIEAALNNKINDIDDLNTLISLLRLSVYDSNNDIYPIINDELKKLKERYGLKLW